MEQLLFGAFSGRTRASARAVVRVPNPVHAVLCLIASFVSACALMMLLQVEFMSLIFVVVYVGAIAVLFLFVVMMLNLGSIKDPMSSQVGLLSVMLLGLVGLQMMLRRGSYGDKRVALQASMEPTYVAWVDLWDPMTTMDTLGQLLYTHSFVYLLLAGFVLLVARIGAIVLTLKIRTFARSKRQQVHQQRSRDSERAVMLTRLVK